MESIPNSFDQYFSHDSVLMVLDQSMYQSIQNPLSPGVFSVTTHFCTMFNDAALDLIFDNEDADVAATVITCSNDIILEGFHYDTASDNESVEDHR